MTLILLSAFVPLIPSRYEGALMRRQECGEGAVLAGVVRSHAPERPRDPTGRHYDRSAGSLLDWDRANRVTPGKLRVPGSADLGLSFLPWRKASAARGAPEGAAFSLAGERPAPPSADLLRCASRRSAPSSFEGASAESFGGRRWKTANPRRTNNRAGEAWLFETWIGEGDATH